MEGTGEHKKTVSEREEETLAFWQDNKIFEKSLELRRGAEEFVFYDGPPFATGLPHYGHIVASVLKDVIPRYQTMRGKHVPRRWGWDCHGLPLENIVEQELKLAHKKDIEEYGVAKFNRAAENTVLRYADDWKRVIGRIGRWADMEHDYKTMDWSYTESVWWIFKTLHEKGLIEEGYKSMHLCPRCETTLANFEVSQGYKDIKDIAVTVKFELESEPGTFVLAWTTTPWTLPGNVALAVNPKILYVIIKKYQLHEGVKKVKEGEELPYAKGDFEFYIVAKDRIQEVFSDDYEILEEFLGSELVRKKYKPLFDYYVKDKSLKNYENGWKIYAADFVTTDEGTGIVHIAPAFGEEDMALGKKESLPFVQHVTLSGTFKPEVRDFAGLPVKPKEHHQSADIEILKYLDARELLFKKETITHSYPHCWRCDTPLLNYAAHSWFVMVTKIKEKLIAANKEINWTPAHLKEGRFGKGLETAPDWAISRSRYWGAPLPVWRCELCKNIKVVGSLAELEERRTRPKNKFFIMRHGTRDDIPPEAAYEYEKQASIIVRSKVDADIHVTARGKEELRKTAEEMKQSGIVFDAIYASPFLRTQETAAIFGEVFGVATNTDERIGELDHGSSFEGRTIADYRAFFASPLERFTKAPEGGESLVDVRRRMMNFLREIDAAEEGKNILVVSHGDPLWMLEESLANKTPDKILEDRKSRYMRQGEVREIALFNWPYDEDGRLNLHRPYIDEIALRCDCGGIMKRIPEVFDCWFESGSMPYGQYHHPFGQKEVFNPESGRGFPADFIAEGLDQTRGWFYSLHVLATALFESPAYKNVLVNGTILAEDGQKMSKRLKNYPDPMQVVEKYGADALRVYLMLSPAGYAEDLNFSEKGVDEIFKKIIQRLSNVYSFYEMYKYVLVPDFELGHAAHALDKFLVYELAELARIVAQAVDAYRLDRAARAIYDFVDVFSTVYLQYSRDRFKEGEDGRTEALSTFRYAILETSKIIAPFMPFLADYLYQNVRSEAARESVHLEDWPSLAALPGGFKEASEHMKTVRLVVEQILAARSEAGIPVRQPLARAKAKELPNGAEFIHIISERTNIERLEKDAEMETNVWLDTAISSELKEKGMLREFIRGLQDARKKEGLKPSDHIGLRISPEDTPKDFFEKRKEEIRKAVGADDLEFVSEKGAHQINLGGGFVSVSIDHSS